MPGSFAVRPATVHDARPAVDLMIAIAHEPDLMLGWDGPFDPMPLVENIQTWVNGGENAVIVAEGDGSIIGSLWVLVEKGAGEVRLNVDAAWRDRGVGRAMIERGIAWARERGVHKLWLRVFPQNARAVALYQRCGFEVEGTQRRRSRRPDGRLWDSMLMGLLLEE